MEETGIAQRVDTEVAIAVPAHIRAAVDRVVVETDIGKKVGAAVDAGDMPGCVERALQTKIDAHVESKVAQVIATAGIEDKVNAAMEEAGIKQQVNTQVTDAVPARIRTTADSAIEQTGMVLRVQAHISVAIKSAVAGVGIKEKVGPHWTLAMCQAASREHCKPR